MSSDPVQLVLIGDKYIELGAGIALLGAQPGTVE